MHLPDDELAWFAATLFNINVDPPTMLSIEKKRKAVQIKSVEGDYDVFGRDLQDARLTLASQLTTVAEMTQTIGRARPYEPRTKRQTVLIYSNMPLPMHVSKASMREEYLESLNIRVQPARMPEKIREAMLELSAGGSFGYADIAKKTSLNETTLKTDDRYKTAVVLASDALGLRFIRGGDGKTGRFIKEHDPKGSISDLELPDKTRVPRFRARQVRMRGAAKRTYRKEIRSFRRDEAYGPVPPKSRHVGFVR